MAERKSPSGPIKRPSDQDILKSLKDFRKETLHVTAEDQARWKGEARCQPAGPPSGPRGPVPAPPPRPRRSKHRKPIAAVMLLVCAITALFQIDPIGRWSAWRRSISSPATSAAAPRPSATVQPLPPLPPAFTLAQAYLVCRFEILLRRSVPARPAAELGEPESFEFDGTGADGPAQVFVSPAGSDPLARYRQLTPGGRIPDSSLVSHLGRLLRGAVTPDERLLAGGLVDDPGEVASQGKALLAHLTGRLRGWVVSFVTGLALAQGASPADARDLLVEAARQAPVDDLWPARALALFDGASEHGPRAITALTDRFGRAPNDELAGYELARWFIAQGRAREALAVVDRLVALPAGDSARLLGASLAVALRDRAKAKAYLAPLEADANSRPKPLQARILALKGKILLLDGTSQARPALQSFEMAIAKDRRCSLAYLSLARMLAGQKRIEESISSYQHYLKLKPWAHAAHRELTKLLLQAEFHALALGECHWLLVHEKRRREWIDGFLTATAKLARPDLVRYELSSRR